MLGSTNVVISTIQRVFKALRTRARSPTSDDPGLDDYVPDAPVTVSLQPRAAAGDLRPGHRRRGPPLHLRRVARGAGVLRRPHRRPDRHPRQADLRVLPAEPGQRVHLPPVGRRPGQRRLRPLPDPHRDHRAGLGHRGRHHRAEGRPPHPRASGSRQLDEDLEYTDKQLDRAVTAKNQIRAGAGDLPRPAVHRDLPRPLHRARRR